MKNIDTILDGEMVAFCPKEGITYSGNVTVLTTTAVKLGATVTISISGVGVGYKAGEIVIFVAGVTYAFSTSTPCHILK